MDMAPRSKPRYTMADVRARAVKERDAWWTVFLVDPIASPLSLFVANHTPIRPNHLTVLSLGMGLGAGAAFWAGTTGWLLIGAGLYHLSFVVDCMDGKVARLTGRGSPLGSWLDYIGDRVRVLAVVLALMGGQFRLTGNEVYVYLGIVVVFLDMLRYLDALQEYKLRREALDALARDTGRGLADAEAAADARVKDVVAARYGWYGRFRDALEGRRVRPHIFSGVEFQMTVFIIAPLTRAIVPVTVVACALLVVFEAAIVAKMFMSLRSIDRLRSAAEPPR